LSLPRRRSLVAASAAVAALVLSLFAIAPSPASAAPTWAPAATAAIHPGVQTLTNGAQCTANFVFTDGTNVYIGQAAHCSGTGASTETNGCLAASLPLGTEVQVNGASRPGHMIYNSWLAMQSKSPALDPNSEECLYNDLAIVALDPVDFGNVNPSIPHWGGPVLPASGGTAIGDTVYSSGTSELRLGISLLSPKRGISLGDSPGGWSHTVYTITPGIPGDSGSAFLDANGHPLGILSTVALAPLAGSNGVGDVGREVAWMHAHGGPSVAIAAGDVPFNGNQLPLG
jgi:hypothetical protein